MNVISSDGKRKVEHNTYVHYCAGRPSCQCLQINALAISVKGDVVCKGWISSPLYYTMSFVSQMFQSLVRPPLTLIFKAILPLISELKSRNVYDSLLDNRAFA
jgi:hypothetical protein